jgi:hypothetical protein
MPVKTFVRLVPDERFIDAIDDDVNSWLSQRSNDTKLVNITMQITPIKEGASDGEKCVLIAAMLLYSVNGAV